jgi:hypothetical protein
MGLPVKVPPLPGRHVTDHQMRLYMTFRQTDGPTVSAAKAAISTPTAYRFEQDHRLPSLRRSASDGRRLHERARRDLAQQNPAPGSIPCHRQAAFVISRCERTPAFPFRTFGR